MRSAVKSIIYNCNLCKRYRKGPQKRPAPGNLRKFRSELGEPFQATGIDFAGPLIYKDRDQEMKGYIVILTCATAGAVHLKLSRSILTEELKYTLEEFIARCATPRTIIIDNAKTFKAASNWLQATVHDEDFFNFLNLHRTEWKFNMSRAPWWGGFFERLIGIMKRALTKKIGRALLQHHELEDVLLNVECFMNNRPLCYVGEEFDRPVLTPNILLRSSPAGYLEEDAEATEYQVCKRRMRYLSMCREQLRKRWKDEYLKALQERHKKSEDSGQALPDIENIVLIADDNNPKSKWNLGKIVDVIIGRDGVIQGYKIRNNKGYTIERPLQLIRDLEIKTASNDVDRASTETNQHAKADERITYERKAKMEARDRIIDVNLQNDNEL